MPEASFGPYRELTRIAVGGSAEVFKARDGRNGELVALKVMLPSSGAVADFAQEALLQKQLRHPNLVAVHEQGVVDGLPFLALEYVDGPSLATVLAERKLSVATALHIALRVLDALSAVHDARGSDGKPLEIVHRDVTPQNIMFASHGEVKLGDFGIAKSRAATRTRTGMIKGKLGYLAPEQVTQSAVDARTDLYQLGLVLFEMLCGVPYFGDMNELELLRAAEAPEPKRPSAYGAPTSVDAVVQRALKRFPEERYASADAFASEIASVATTLEAPDLSFVRSAEPCPRVKARARVGIVVAVSAVLAVAGGLATAVLGSRAAMVTSAPAEVAPSAAPVSNETLAPPTLAEAPAAPPKKARQTKRDTPQSLAAAPMTEAERQPSVEPSRDILEPCIERLRTRGIATSDLPAALQRDLENPAADKAALCAQLDAMTVDRAVVERKLTRLQSAIDRLAPDDPRRPALKGIARDTLQTLLDGNVPRTNEKLRELERLLAR